MNFFLKFIELQTLMLQHNAGLTASHPYATNPINWPFLLSGISFWTQNDTKRQIYMIGNVVGWWTCVISLSVFTGIIGADLLARRRGIQPIPECTSFDSFFYASIHKSPPLQSSVTVSGTHPAFSLSHGRSITSPST
jgi:dolichyl-phosphate-mannose--protein O-mannosyl transferase